MSISHSVQPSRRNELFIVKRMNLSTNSFFTHGIDKLCTICHLILIDADSSPSHSIFSTLEELESPGPLNVLQVLQSFSNFNFYNGPEMVCTTCYNKTIEVYKFIQMCNKAHENIQNYLIYGEDTRTRNDSNYEEIDVMEVDLKMEEIDFSPTRITTDGLLDEIENERASIIDEVIISSPDIKIEEGILQEGMEKEETSNNEENSIFTREIVTEEKTGSSDFDNHRIEQINAERYDERIGLIKSKDCHLVFSDEAEAKELTSRSLPDHIRTHTNEKSFLGELCKASFGTNYNLRSHDQRHNAQLACISKDLRLNQDRHQPLKDQETDVVCPECQEVFYNDTHLKIHMRSHEKNCLCNDCGKVFTTESRLNTHIHVHSGDSYNEVKVKTLHKCEHCDRRFTRAAYLRSHMNIHNAIKPYKCEQCDRRFTHAPNLSRHMLIHNVVKAHKCEQCDRQFTQVSYLRSHIKSHNGVKAHKCEQCDKRFTQPATLRSHMDIHNGVKALKCLQCDRLFSRTVDLRRHMDFHNGVKEHKCEQCGRQFTLASDLRRHMDIHTGVKAHKCEQCDRRFTQAAHLRTHMHIHTGVKAHKCEQCDQRFTMATNLRRHMMIHNRKL